MSSKPKSSPPVHADQTASQAFACILRHNFDYLLTWQDPARDWENIEGVHQLRVAVRRMRSALNLFRDAVPREASDPWNKELRWIGGQLGLARDLDVFISEGLITVGKVLILPGQAELRTLAETRRAQVYEQQVRPLLDSERWQRFCDEFPTWIERRAWEKSGATKKQTKRLASGVCAYSRRLLDKQERRVLTVGTGVEREDQNELHQLRIECKKLRYAAEFFRPIVNNMDEFIHHMKGIQDLLGVMNDVSVTRQLLADLFPANDDDDVLLYAGAILGWRTCEYCHLLGKFDDYWEELVSAKHPWWKKS